MWLGLSEERDNIFTGLEEGYGLVEDFMNDMGLPTTIFYSGRFVFELRCYIFQGRNLLGLGILKFILSLHRL